ncbi:MAG: hypothetical protein V4481_01155 [Patescibacteria group bacterium]
MKKQQKGFITVLVGIIIALAVGGYVAWSNNLIPKDIVQKFHKEPDGQLIDSTVKNANSETVSLLTKNSGPLIILLTNLPGSEVTVAAQSGLQITKQATSQGKVVYAENYFGFSSKAIIDISGTNYKKTIPNTYSAPSRYLTFKTPLDMKPGVYKLKVTDYTDPKSDVLVTSNQIDFKVDALPVCKEGMIWNGKFCDYKNYTHDANGKLIPDCGTGKTWNGAKCMNE